MNHMKLILQRAREKYTHTHIFVSLYVDDDDATTNEFLKYSSCLMNGLIGSCNQIKRSCVIFRIVDPILA